MDFMDNLFMVFYFKP